MRRLLYTLFFASLLTACGGNDDNLPEPEPLPVVEGDRAVLVYMADDNSLDNSTVDFAGEDMKEMVEGLGTFNTEKNVHLLVYVDKKRKIADAPDASFPCLMELTNEDGVGKYTVLKEYESPRNSVGLDEMKEVFKDVFSAYQASSYGLVYWSHGDGWVPQRLPDTRWIGQDGNNYMDLSEFAEALQVVPYLDFLMFDACFMQSVEVAYALRNEADYIIASPTEIPGPGAPYKEIMQWIMTEGAAKQIGEVYYDMYRAKYNGGVGMSNDNWTGGVSIAVTRTEDLEALAQATREALSTITPPLEPSVLRNAALNYDRRSSSVGYHDMYRMMQELIDDDTFNLWKSKFESTMVYWGTTPMNYSFFAGMFSMEEKGGSHGLSHYIPFKVNNATTTAYHSTQWYTDAGIEALGW